MIDIDPIEQVPSVMQGRHHTHPQLQLMAHNGSHPKKQIIAIWVNVLH